jgi:hypothetical protein
MVGCVYVGKALVRAPKPRRFVAPCAESAGCVHGEGCAGVGGRTAAAPRRLAGVQRRSRGASPPMSAVYVASSWLRFMTTNSSVK